MKPIETESWAPFAIGELFDVVKGTRLTKAAMLPGDIRFIGSSAMNNGVTAYIGNDEHLHSANTITVCYNGSVGESFYQDEPFWASDDVNVLYPKFDLTRNIALFITPLLREVGHGYSYIDKWKQDVMASDSILLPVCDDGSPDWLRMDTFMTDVIGDVDVYISKVTEAIDVRHPVNRSGWREFYIGELFRVEKGSRLTKADMRPGDTPFIGATLENNGITAHIGNTEHVHPGGIMTVAYDGQKAMGKAFYQPVPFWASDSINVLYPNFELTDNIALFLIPLFWEASKPFSYDDKWGKEAMARTTIPLPADVTGNPNWELIEEMSASWRASASSTLDAFLEAISAETG